MTKAKVGIIFGGKSAEHEVSLQSAKNIVDAIDKDKYEVVLLGIDKDGKWHLNDQSSYLLNEENPKLIQLNKTNKGVAVVPGESSNQLVNTSGSDTLSQLDVVFPIVHGTLGEDGSLQGMLRIANLPYVGTGVLGSAVSMDKDIAKRLLKEAGISVANSVTFTKNKRNQINYQAVKEKLGLPMFIKPANQGSSVGVSKVRNEEEFYAGIDDAFLYDHKLLVEEMVNGREVECAVLGNEDPQASIPGEILPQTDFYSYESKYIDEKGADLAIPADLSEELTKKVQQASVEVFQTLNCEGLARVDFFLKEDGELVVNEVNTLPGFTRISMYPKLWEISGISYPELINKLIELAIDRHQRDAQLKSAVWED
ncbi:D-alanine--D-alanine ligase [Aquibacillus koreensis]|uniref:D-alanine--D-alanine ligase n=1 Tax=Aquibacillus koreensis TaxID=279446 RepID=A0A9X4AL85_9BACI|nr:D-alanine--D-alanine ligase [Aquibacillus koreensis]MCT2536233.1 D-alanine--D-alanine ligase [Aquibacillus koreensis]MDC3422213.1 D-alanine--D-alanine ligase [Aquibacillus koreensis]